MSGMTFLVLRQLGVDNEETGGYVVAVDAVGAGVGEVVMYASGSSARQTEITETARVMPWSWRLSTCGTSTAPPSTTRATRLWQVMNAE